MPAGKMGGFSWVRNRIYCIDLRVEEDAQRFSLEEY
jgi:hypothetical protein